MDFVSIIGGATSGLLVALGVGYFGFYSKTKTDIAVMTTKCKEYDRKLEEYDEKFARIAKLETDVAVVQKYNDVFWKVLEPHLAAIIHSPIHVRRDELTDKLVNGTLTVEEAHELQGHLEEAINDPVEMKRIAAALLLARTCALMLSMSSAQKDKRSNLLIKNQSDKYSNSQLKVAGELVEFLCNNDDNS